MGLKDDLYSNQIILNSVLPLLKVLAENRPDIGKGFTGKNAVIQFSAKDNDSKIATHFIISDGSWSVGRGLIEKPDVDFEFKSIAAFNEFFKGKSSRLPKIKGVWHLGIVIPTFKALLTMSKLLGAKTPPEKKEDKELLVKMLFYLLTSGISQLNKAGHPEVAKWALKSPDRVYALAVNGKPELSAYIRVKAGNSRSSRGEYTRSKPFFTLRFDCVDSALGILLETDDMIEATIKERILMEGAPEFGAQMGEFMKLVGSYVK